MNKYFELQQFKESLAEREKPIDTLVLQLTSLQCFMEGLGYDGMETQWGFRKDRKCFKKGNTMPEFISFALACRLHNGMVVRVTSHAVEVLELHPRLKIPLTNYRLAQSYKLVEKVKLQLDKKSPLGVKVQNHYVQLKES